METNIINKKRLAGHWVSQRHLHLKRTHIYILTSPFIAPLTVINIFPYTLEQLTVTSQSISSAFRFRTLLFCLILLWHFYICAYRIFNINIFFFKMICPLRSISAYTIIHKPNRLRNIVFHGRCLLSFHRFKNKLTALWKI